MINTRFNKHIMLYTTIVVVVVMNCIIWIIHINKEHRKIPLTNEQFSQEIHRWKTNRKAVIFSVKDATLVANKHLKKYCENNLVILSNVKLTYIKKKLDNIDGDKWIFTYQYIGRRNARLYIVVDEYGDNDIAGIGPNFR
ncbi:MAG: hypothetical protein ACYC1M_06905 [Armatimonadota bacterium]